MSCAFISGVKIVGGAALEVALRAARGGRQQRGERQGGAERQQRAAGEVGHHRLRNQPAKRSVARISRSRMPGSL